MKCKFPRKRVLIVHRILIFTISMMICVLIFSNIPDNAEAGDGEPIVNFYVEWELTGHTDYITALSWSENGLWIASGSSDNSTIIWSTSTWNEVRTLDHPAPVNELAWSQSTQRIAISYGNGSIDIYNSAGWGLVENLTQHIDDVRALDWNPTGSALASGDDTGIVEIWDTSSWNSQKTLGMPGGVKDLKWSNNGNKLTACSDEGTIKVWDTTTWMELRSFDVTSGDESTESITWSPDDSELGSSSGDDMVRVWNTISWNAVQIKNAVSPCELDWGDDGSYLIVGTIGGIKIWDVSSWDEIQTKDISGNSQVAAISFNPDGDRMASGPPSKENNTVLIWEKNLSPVLDTIGNMNTLEDEPFAFTAIASDDDVLVFSEDSELFEIDPDSGQISFTPTNDDVGEHDITITVDDEKGGVDSETFTLTIINVDDPPEPIFNWFSGAEYVNITLRLTGEMGNSVSLQIMEDGTPTQEVVIEREGGNQNEHNIHINMNHTRSYNINLNYSGDTGENPVALSFENGGIVRTEHILFDSTLGSEQTVDLALSDILGSMGIVMFDASQSIDVDSGIIDYQWDFGDGEMGSGIVISHYYKENGIYNVGLLVESDNGVNRSVDEQLVISDIPSPEYLVSLLMGDQIVGYLESTDQNAVIFKGNSRVRIQDTRGRITGFEDDDFISEIEDVHLMFNIFGIRIFYVPRDTELTLAIQEDAEEYQLLTIMPRQGSQRSFNINGSQGKISMKLGEDGNSFSISTEDEYIRYWVKMEYENSQNTMDFSLNEINVSRGEIHHYSINEWENIEEAKAVSLKIDKDKDGDVDFNIELEDQMTGEEIQVIIKNMGKSSSPFLTTSMILLIVGFIGLTGFGVLFGSTEVGKLAFLALILPLYTRIKKEEVLDNEIRGMIRGYIIANPGDNYNSIKRALDLNNGALAYHLKVLEKAKIIQSRQNGMYKRFYPASMKIPSENGMQISEIQKLVLAKVKESPGISQKEITRLLGLSKGVINYHVKVLFSKNMLRMEKRGRRTQCYVNSHIIDGIKNKEKVN